MGHKQWEFGLSSVHFMVYERGVILTRTNLNLSVNIQGCKVFPKLFNLESMILAQVSAF